MRPGVLTNPVFGNVFTNVEKGAKMRRGRSIGAMDHIRTFSEEHCIQLEM